MSQGLDGGLGVGDDEDALPADGENVSQRVSDCHQLCPHKGSSVGDPSLEHDAGADEGRPGYTCGRVNGAVNVEDDGACTEERCHLCKCFTAERQWGVVVLGEG